MIINHYRLEYNRKVMKIFIIILNYIIYLLG